MSGVELSHKGSAICSDETLALFSTLSSAPCIEAVESINVWPQNTITQGSPLNFLITNLQANQYVNLANAYFTFKLRLKGTDGKAALAKPEEANAADNAKITFSNGLASTLIRSIAAYMGETKVSHNDDYFIRNSLDLLLHTPRTELHSVVGASQRFDPVTRSARTSVTHDDWATRYAITKEGKEFTLIAPLNCDIASSNRWFMPGVDFRFVVELRDPKFYLTGTEHTRKFHLQIDDAYLTFWRGSILPSVSVANEMMLKTRPAVYPIRYVRTTDKTLQQGVTKHAFDLALGPQLPYSLTCILLPTKVWLGAIDSEPLFFESHKLESAKLEMAMQTLSYTYKDNMLSAYYATCMSLAEKNVELTFDHFKKQSFFIHFDLASGVPKGALRAVKRSGLRLELEFSEALTENLSCLILAESIGHIEVDAYRQVKVCT